MDISFISNLWNSGNTNNASISNSEILNIGSALNGILSEINLPSGSISTPKIVVVGTQSSGKSSVLNGLLSMDILPTGKTLVTRTPLNMQLVQTSKNIWAEFGIYQESEWKVLDKIIFNSIVPTEGEIDKITKNIKSLTEKYAGNGMGISDKEIFLKIYSPNVPNLNLVDLPGLTMVACTDQGQPKDIKIQIQNMIKKYISSERTIILAVMPAREDLEADYALDFIKEIDPNGDRTLGVLTKIDLMNKGTNISKYLLNNVSRDLKLKYGYFAIKNRSHSQCETMNILEGLKAEQEFFNSHSIYGSIRCPERLGIGNLGKTLSTILVSNIRKYIPDILSEISIQKVELEKKINLMGNPVPQSNEDKTILLNSIINKISSDFIDSIDKRGFEINSGRKIKDIFLKFKNKINYLNPFSFEFCNDLYLKDIILNCEGNHMSFPLPPIEVLESCLSDPKKKPFNVLLPVSISCIKEISELLINLVKELINKEDIKRFGKLANNIQDAINAMILNNQENTISKIEEIIETEQNYIWTDDKIFLDNLQKMFNNMKYPLEIESIRKILIEYFNSIKKIIQHSIPKFIMLFLIKNTQTNLRSNLYQKIQKKDFIDLLSESPEIEKQRILYNTSLKKLISAKKILEEI